jgi:hypothetical protein
MQGSGSQIWACVYLDKIKISRPNKSEVNISDSMGLEYRA